MLRLTIDYHSCVTQVALATMGLVGPLPAG
jgi:hypothetical protein